MLFRDDYRRLLRRGGLAVWAAVGFPVLITQLLAPSRTRDVAALAAWAAALLLFGIAFERATARRGSDRRGALALVAGQTAAVLALVALPPCFGLEGVLLVLVALQLGGLLGRRAARGWIVLQTAALLGVVWLHWGWHWGVVLAFAYLPFQLIADATTRLLGRGDGRPREARRGQRRARIGPRVCSRAPPASPSAPGSPATSTTFWATT